MQIFYKDLCSLGIEEYEVHKFSAEASTLGLKPGEWPNRIDTDMGNKMPFLFPLPEVRDGDLLWVTYRQGNGCISLRVYND